MLAKSSNLPFALMRRRWTAPTRPSCWSCWTRCSPSCWRSWPTCLATMVGWPWWLGRGLFRCPGVGPGAALLSSLASPLHAFSGTHNRPAPHPSLPFCVLAVVQRFLQLGGPEVHGRIKSVMGGRVLALSLQMYGCRVVQKALEVSH